MRSSSKIPPTVDLLLESTGLYRAIRAVRAMLPDILVCRFDEQGKVFPLLTEEDSQPAEAGPCDLGRCEPVLRAYLSRTPDTSGEQEAQVLSCPQGGLMAVCVFTVHSRRVGGILLLGRGEGDRETLSAATSLLQEYSRTALILFAEHDDLELVHELWDAMASTSEVDELLSVALSQLLAGFGLERGAIFLTDPEGQALVRHVEGVHGPVVEEHPLVVCNEECAHLYKDPSIAQPVSRDSPLFAWAVKALRLDPKGDHLYAVPFRREADLLGFAGVVSPDAMAPDASERMMLQTLVEGISALIRSLLNMQEAHERHLALRSIHAIHRLMGAAQGKEELLARLCELTLRATGADKGSIMTVHESGKMLIPAAGVRLAKHEVGTFPLPIGEGLPGKVAETLEWRQIDCLSPESESLRTPPEAYPSRAYLSIPIVEESLLGVLTVAMDRKDFDVAARELLLTLSEEIVVAVKNAELQETRQHVHLEVLRTLMNLMESQDPETPGHSARVCDLAYLVGYHLGLGRRELYSLQYAALLYDAGYLTAPASRTISPSGDVVTTRGETTISFDQHVSLSERLAECMVEGTEVREIIARHHEHYDGTGFPDGLKGEEIPVGSRILACCDYYISAAEDSSQEPGEKARMLQGMRKLVGSRFDPGIFACMESELNDLDGEVLWPNAAENGR